MSSVHFRMCILLLLGGLFYRVHRSNSSSVIKSSLSLLIYLTVLPFTENGVLMSPTIAIKLSISHFSFLKFFHILLQYFERCMYVYNSYAFFLY
jgi:hypothetical protein